MTPLPPDYHTFLKKRKCLHCGAPIADQAHATTKFCPRVELPDGSIKSCRDDYHAPKNKKKNLPFKKIADYHKAVHMRLTSLWAISKDGAITIEH